MQTSFFFSHAGLQSISGTEISKFTAHLFLNLWTTRKLYSTWCLHFQSLKCLSWFRKAVFSPGWCGKVCMEMSMLTLHLWFLSHQLLGIQHRVQKQREQALQDLCKARAEETRHESVGLLRTDSWKRKLVMARKSIANKAPLFSLPPKHHLLQNPANIKIYKPSQN